MGDDQARPAGIAGIASTGGLLEIGCDESGSEGEKLIGGNTDVFAHAGVGLSVASAAECVQETRNRIRSPAQEYKANHLLREKHRAVLEWLLGPSGPIHGNAHVHLIDKEFFAVGKLVELLTGEITGEIDGEIDGETAGETTGKSDGEVTEGAAGQAGRPAGTGARRDRRAEETALILYRDGRDAFGGPRWDAFLEAFNDLVRARVPAEDFLRAVDDLRLTGARGGDGRAAEIMASLAWAGPRAASLRKRLTDGTGAMPVLDPLIPAVVQAVLHWGRGGRPVSIVHDEHYALTRERVARLTGTLGEQTAPGRSPAGRLAGLRLVDSRSDPRVQVADFLAGVARRIASDELNGRGDTVLVTLLRPYVVPSSVWGDRRSRILSAPGAGQPASRSAPATSAGVRRREAT
ncbi:DUF3800 domain-containing protein [Streptosporangium sp. DT93]|uniref:DUF3800 domain-containing protein n=1 Tax=Streptosporangium sp. DT93 TaxID=3393428 RepID=UPI003CF29C33